MIASLIKIALRNRIFIVLVAASVVAYGVYAVKTPPVDAIPDLSENQVIIFTQWMGRIPQIIEDQVTYPLVSNFQGIPREKIAGLTACS
jgi:Cu/Ag efflux pump CusA